MKMKFCLKHQKQMFTLVEIIVVVTIVSVLSTVSYIGYNSYYKNSRDSIRLTDVANINIATELFVEKAGKAPIPDGTLSYLTYSGGLIFEQGIVGDGFVKKIQLGKPPLDPFFKDNYTFSRLSFGREFEIKADLELDNEKNKEEIVLLNSSFASISSDKRPFVFIKGTYKGLLAKTLTGGNTYILSLPSLILNTTGNVDYLTSSSSLLFNNQRKTDIITYNPYVLSTKLPDIESELTTMMQNLKNAYTGSYFADKGNVGEIFLKDSYSLNQLGAIIVERDLKGEIIKLSK